MPEILELNESETQAVEVKKTPGQLAGADRRREEAAAWVPPGVLLGDEVVFYEAGDIRDDSSWGKVIGVSGKSVSIQICSIFAPSGEFKQDVLHKDDPWLAERPDRRSQGSWDFSPRQKRLNQMLPRLESLDAVVAGVEAGLSKSNEAFSRLERLDARVIDIEAALTTPLSALQTRCGEASPPQRIDHVPQKKKQ